MFTIRYDNRGFRISIGDGSPVFARDVDELHKALDHYYMREKGNDYDGCPFCRWMAEHSPKPRREPHMTPAAGGNLP